MKFKNGDRVYFYSKGNGEKRTGSVLVVKAVGGSKFLPIMPERNYALVNLDEETTEGIDRQWVLFDDLFLEDARTE